MSASVMFFIEVDSIVHIELSHIFGECLSFDFDEQVVVVGHEAIVVDSDIMRLGIKAHQLFEVCIVLFVFKDHSLFNTTVDDMIKAVYFDAGFTGHELLLYRYGGSIA
jgi:hypothetical protein